MSRRNSLFYLFLMIILAAFAISGCTSESPGSQEASTELEEKSTEAEVSESVESEEEISDQEEASLSEAESVESAEEGTPLMEETEVSEEVSGKNSNGVYVFIDEEQDFCFYVPADYKDTAKTYGNGGAVVYTNPGEDIPYYTLNRYTTDKTAYVYALWEAMAIEEEHEKYLAGGAVEPQEMQAGNRTIFSVKANYLDPDSGKSIEEFVYVEQLTDGVMVYKTKYYPEDTEVKKATQAAVELAMNYVCMSADYDPDHLGPNHIAIP
ncbi:MAG: hypothetical protein IJ137_01415 [Eubacterium sp.]|nr:hypothetical protein [Eubacterium sp.]